MDENKPISGELAAMLPALSQTMGAAIQSLRQSSALAGLLVAKGLVTQAELDAALKSTADPAKNLRETLLGFDKKPD